MDLKDVAPPPGFLQVFIPKDFKPSIFGSVHSKETIKNKPKVNSS